MATRLSGAPGRRVWAVGAAAGSGAELVAKRSECGADDCPRFRGARSLFECDAWPGKTDRGWLRTKGWLARRLRRGARIDSPAPGSATQRALRPLAPKPKTRRGFARLKGPGAHSDAAGTRVAGTVAPSPQIALESAHPTRRPAANSSRPANEPGGIAPGAASGQACCSAPGPEFAPSRPWRPPEPPARSTLPPRGRKRPARIGPGPALRTATTPKGVSRS